MVRPTKSGRMVERRDQVLIGRLSPLPRTFSTLPTRWWSTNGPFLTERPMSCPLFLVTSIDNHAAGAFVLARAVALDKRAPWTDRMPAGRGLAFTAAVRVIDRVQRHAAHRRAHTAPAHTPGLSHRFQRMLCLAHFARTQAQLGITSFTRQELHRSSGRACDLRAFARQHLGAMHGGAPRD